MRSRVLSLVLLVLGAVAIARSGHELPVYPSYYPHEIEIAAVEPGPAGAQLIAGQLHAYVGGAPRFDAVPPNNTIASVPSLGSFVVVALNPGSPLAQDEATACSVASTIVRELATKGGSVIAHPYPVTPLHGDYLHHIDLAETAIARFAGPADASSASRALKVRAEGALAQGLVRPEWRAQGADWDATLLEVDARLLVASATTHVNGWMGPRWTRSGWFHAHRTLAEWIAEPELRQRADADLGRLQAGELADAAERINLERDLVRRLTSGCRAMVAGYTLAQNYFNVGSSAGIENIAYDGLEGFVSPMFLRTVKLKDFPWNGWLKLGTAAPPTAAWNPVGGFTDEFGRLMWFAVSDPAAIPSPYDHTWVLNRISEVEASPRR